MHRSTYVRKTRDTWQLWINYGYGWEHETTELSRADKREQDRCYAQAVPQYPRKWITKRERITTDA